MTDSTCRSASFVSPRSSLAGLLLALALLLVQSGALTAQDDFAKDLKGKDVAKRLYAVSRIVEKGHADAEKLLQKACKDKDWEVVLRAAGGLASHGSANSIKVLVGVAISHPLTAVRSAAAESLRKLDETKAVAALAGKLKGKTRLNAARALVIVGYPEGWKRFEKMTKSKEQDLIRVGIEGLGTTKDARAAARINSFLGNGDVGARAAAARALTRLGSDEALGHLLGRLSGKTCLPVMERRLIVAVREVLSGREGDEQKQGVTLCLEAWKTAKSGANKAACARLLGRLGRRGESIGESAEYVQALVTEAPNRAPQVQSAIAMALGMLGGDQALASIAGLAHADDQRVRFHAVRAALATGEKGAEKLLVEVMGADSSLLVREEGAVQLGRGLLTTAAPGLRKALGDSEWRVVLAAAMSLGKVQDAEAVAPLAALLAHDDFRVRAAGAAGLGLGGRKAAVEHLIGALRDKDPLVKDTALDYLQRITTNRAGAQPAKWKKWWAEHQSEFSFKDRLVKRKRAKEEESRYDRFRHTPYDAFKNFLVIVLAQSRDKMEKILEVLKIEHVLTRTGKVQTSGLQPNAAFLANCPGQVNEDDKVRIEWFVRSGGHLFTTCVALTNTVMKTFPGVLRLPPPSQAPPGKVNAHPVDTQEDYLHGVFDDHSRPLYKLAGHQLPVAVDRDRVNVLIDSPDACTLWGSGNLAAWFGAGHGVVVHSANHFVLQGMDRLKSAKERKAFALERLGISFRKLRELDKKGVFKSQTQAAKLCRDETMMRLVARFVYAKRRGEY